jgi:prophage regulatory protein
MRILRLPRVEDKTGLKHAEIYDRMREGDFPRPIPLGARARGWLEAEVDDWIRLQMAKRDRGKAA